MRTAEGWLYVAAIMDLYSRRIVGWATGASLAAALVLRALAMAVRHRRPPAARLYHSDRRSSMPAATSAQRWPARSASPA